MKNGQKQVPILLEAGLSKEEIIIYSSFLYVGMLKHSSREDRRVKKESMLGLELLLMKYCTYKVLCE